MTHRKPGSTHGQPAAPGAWAEAAACLNRGPDMEAPQRAGGLTRQDWAHIAAARAICHSCPVRVPCERWALTTPDPAVGMIAGGWLPTDRQRIRNGEPAIVHYPGRNRRYTP